MDACESIIASWLKNIKECQVVQTNWKQSHFWQKSENKRTKVLFDSLKTLKANNETYCIFSGCRLSDFMKQHECDCFGLQITDRETKLYAVEVAYHENNLNYGNGKTKKGTIETIIKKCFRNLFSCLTFFPIANLVEIFLQHQKQRNKWKES